MTKIIRLTESDLTKIVKRVIEEQSKIQTPIENMMKKIKPESGGKYCFSNPKQLNDAYGSKLKLYKIKSGDTLSGIISNHRGVGGTDSIVSINEKCNLSKNIKAGDVIVIGLLPSM
jgi:hypothetical protein